MQRRLREYCKILNVTSFHYPYSVDRIVHIVGINGEQQINVFKIEIIGGTRCGVSFCVTHNHEELIIHNFPINRSIYSGFNINFQFVRKGKKSDQEKKHNLHFIGSQIS